VALTPDDSKPETVHARVGSAAAAVTPRDEEAALALDSVAAELQLAGRWN
jgi:hypothetical protein